MTVTIVNRVVPHMVLWNVDNAETILTFSFVFSLTWLRETEDSIWTIKGVKDLKINDDVDIKSFQNNKDDRL